MPPKITSATTDALAPGEATALSQAIDAVLPPVAAPSTVPTSAPAAPLRTPDNTPHPGGGAWAWSTSRGDWVAENSPDADPMVPDPVPEAAAQPQA